MSSRSFGRLYFDLSRREPNEYAFVALRRTTAKRIRQSADSRTVAAPVRSRTWQRWATVGLAAVLVAPVVGRSMRSDKPAPQAPLRSSIAATSAAVSPEIASDSPMNDWDSPADSTKAAPSPQRKDKAFEYAAVRAVVKQSQRGLDLTAAASTTLRLFPHRSADVLLQELESTGRDIGAHPLKRTAAGKGRIAHSPATTAYPGSRYIAARLAERPVLAGLPFRGDADCHVESDRIGSLLETSQAFDAASLRGKASSHGSFVDESGLIRSVLLAAGDWNSPLAVPTLTQMLQVKDESVRLALVELLAIVPGPEAARALVDRAVFDLSDHVRNSANAALAMRPHDEFRDRLLSGFRHPWPEAARHAAETVAALDSEEFISSLEKLLDEPDPTRPRRDATGRWSRRELVRMNHLGNCNLCHPTVTGDDVDAPAPAFLASMPEYGQPLPTSGGYGFEAEGEKIQVEIVYLQQDFSVIHRTSALEPWPMEQRYDYLVQDRPLTSEEAAAAEAKHQATSAETQSYPQRDAVAAALDYLNRADK